MFWSAIAVSTLYFLVNLLLMICTGRLLRWPVKPYRCVIGGAIAGSFACLSMIIDFSWFTGLHILILVICALTCFGFSKGWLAPSAVYIMLALSLGGARIDFRGAVSLFLGTLGVWMVLFIAKNKSELVPVVIGRAGESIKINALVDTGNLLTDPVTGRAVLIVGADVAGQLTGLTPAQLRNPAEYIGALQGSRLIPYSTVGEHGNFMLAKRINDVQIGSWKGSVLIAFCPELLSKSGKYHALVGGRI